MKHISHIFITIFCLHIAAAKADHHEGHQTVIQQSSSQQVSSQITPEGGTVTIGGQTFHTEPGQSITVQGGGVTTKTQSTQIGDEPAVTVTEVEKRPISVTVDGETTVIPDAGSTTVSVDGPSIRAERYSGQAPQNEIPDDEISDEQHEGIIRRTGQTAVQATQDAADVAVQTTEGAVNTVRNIFSNLFGR